MMIVVVCLVKRLKLVCGVLSDLLLLMWMYGFGVILVSLWMMFCMNLYVCFEWMWMLECLMF